MVTQPPQKMRTGGGLPPGVSIGESWPKMIEELHRSQSIGLLDSLGRRIVERLVAEHFTELGRMIGTPANNEMEIDESGNALDEPRRIPGEVVGGWGRHGGRLLFAVADETVIDAPRNPAGSTVARIVLLEAFRCGAPYVGIACTERFRDDLRSGREFMRVGLQIDFDLEIQSQEAIPKVFAICGLVDFPVLLEAVAAHYVIGGPVCRAVLPDGTLLEREELAELGWIDLVCDSEDEIVESVLSVLSLLPDNHSTLPPAGSATKPSSKLNGEPEPAVVEVSLVDAATSMSLSGLAPGSMRTSLARVGGRPVGVAIGSIGHPADKVRVAKLTRVCKTFSLPMVLVDLADEPTASAQFEIRISANDFGGGVILVRGRSEAPHPELSSSYAAVLAWPKASDELVDAVIEPAATRETIVSFLDNLNVYPCAKSQHRRRAPSESIDAIFE